MNRCLVFLAVLLLGASMTAAAELTVRIDGIKARSGELVVALFDSSQAWEDGGEPVRSAFLPVDETSDGPSIDWQVSDLAPGLYAVKTYHDLDGDRELDRKKIGIPTEPYGFSQRARDAFGPPSFDKAAFELGDEPLTVDIELRGGKRRGAKNRPPARAEDPTPGPADDSR